ncbi:MAG: SUMF1/EgtB/PvdO family nonheme iron enzyme, partial [Phototrophicaceae bacterium]
MINIFISYRRADSRKDAGRIYDRLTEAFGKEAIFKDVDNIPLGKDFRGILREAVAKCDVELVIIGQKWLNIKGEDGTRRLDNTGDFVRIEVESALQRDSCLVVPILVDNAPMPNADELPPVLRELAFKNARSVRDDPDFHSDVSKIIHELQDMYKIAPIKSEAQRKVEAPSFDVRQAIADFYHAFDEALWDDAREILAEIRASDNAPRLFNIDVHEQEIWDAIEAQERDQQYELLRLMARRSNKKRVWDALQVFWQDFPNFDPDTIAEKVRPLQNDPVKPKQLKASADAVRAIIGEPFEWCDVPAGDFLYGDDKQTMTLPDFAMAKYPISYSQYQVFVEASDGLQDTRWWQGLAKSEHDLGEQKWKLDDHPRERVNWYDALAFCRWLSWKMGGEYAIDKVSSWLIRLPTELEWEKAARGTQGLIYPYGNDFDKNKSNTEESGIKKTTPVMQYPQGASPYGVLDMSGNVWEWCLNEYSNPMSNLSKKNISSNSSRVLRGGSWDYDSYDARAAYRHYFN